MAAPASEASAAPEVTESATEDYGQIDVKEYITELEAQIGALTGQIIQSKMVIGKLQNALAEKSS